MCPCGNLVENGDFANGLAGWDTTMNVGVETGNVHSVPNAARLGVPPNVNEPAILAQVIDDIDYNCCYILDFFIDGSRNQPITVQVLFGEVTGAQVVIPATIQPDYSYYRVFVPCPPEGEQVTVVFSKPGTGNIFVDDVGFWAAGVCQGEG